MQRRSFLKTVAAGLLATKLTFDLGAKAVDLETAHGDQWVTDDYEMTYMFWNADTGMRFEFKDGAYVPWEGRPYPETFEIPNY